MSLNEAERFRPHFHFAPRSGWINDPNGLVYHNREYHLFYQHHPYSENLGPMHWGHAVSTDLLAWQELPVALYPDHNGVIFSGSATIDRHNRAGFGADALIAVFTSHDDQQRPVERQSIAFSRDDGRTFAKYVDNPVLVPEADIVDFRDPRIFWYGTHHGGYWVLVLAAGDEVQFYRSDDMKQWTQTGAFGKAHGAHTGVWECPDLFPLPVEADSPDEGEEYWMLVVGIGAGGPARGSATQYFVGHFDGSTFTNANTPETVLWFDWGADFYAAQSWDSAPHGRRIVTAWLSNWEYARTTPTTGWRGSMALPREVLLRRTASGIRLFQQPVAELATRYGRVWEQKVDCRGRGEAGYFEEAIGESLETFDLAIALVPEPDTRRFGVVLRDGVEGLVMCGWDADTQEVWLDRSASGIVDFNPTFAARHRTPLTLTDGELRMRLVVDANSVELFAADGAVAITDAIYPYDGRWQVSVFVEGGGAKACTLLQEVV